MADLLQPATTLEDVYKTLSEAPLLKEDEFRAFYEPSVNSVRGEDQVARIRLRLERLHHSGFYHAFFHGHQGVGKSTELTRLAHEVRFKFSDIRFSAETDINPAGYKPFDVLLVMLMKLVKETHEQTGRAPSDQLLQDVLDWFSKKTKTYKQAVHAEAGASGGAGPKGDSLLTSVLGLFVNVSGAIKYASDRETQVTDYELTLIPELITLVNKLLTECNKILRDTQGREWLFIGEDFDKAIGRPELAKDLFIAHGKIFQDLRAHFIFNVPVELVYSDLGGRLEAMGCDVKGLLDTPVYNQDHTSFEPGRDAVRAVLGRRLSPSLFEDGQMTRLIVASGGNLRDLFSCVADSADTAFLRGGPDTTIQQADVTSAINNLRREYLRHLGVSVYDDQQASPITSEKKTERLLQVYADARKPTMTDAVLNSLLRSRAVQEFNGEGWYGVHPLVVDILHRQGAIKADDQEGVPGGTF